MSDTEAIYSRWELYFQPQKGLVQNLPFMQTLKCDGLLIIQTR